MQSIQRDLELSDFAYGKNGGAMSFFRGVANGSKTDRAGDRLVNSIAEDKWASKTTEKLDEINEIADHLKSCFNRIDAVIVEHHSKYIVNVELLKLVNNLSLLKHLLDITKEIKEQDNVLLISDFYQTISDVISKEPVPFIYERLGVRYEHFLLDEFQDTSHLQWVNLVPLLHNSVSMHKENLIVGDGKQAIYRWRNGEVEQFIDLPQKVYNPTEIASLYEAERSFEQQGIEMPLSTNYRSAPEIVNFNNALFRFLVTDKDEFIQKIYHKCEQEANEKHKGYLEFQVYEDKDDELQLNYVEKVIERAKDEKEYSLSDICILVYRNKTGSKIARHLTAKGISVISQDSLFVSKDLKVKFVFNLICSLANNYSLNYAKKCIEQYDMIFGQQQHLFDLLEVEKIDIVEWFKTEGYELKPNEHFHSFYEYVEHLISAFDLEISSNVYLQFFLEQVHEFEKRHSSDVHTFIEWFNETGHGTICSES